MGDGWEVGSGSGGSSIPSSSSNRLSALGTERNLEILFRLSSV